MFSRSFLITGACLVALSLCASCAGHYYPREDDPRYDPPRFFNDEHDGGGRDDDGWRNRG